MGIIGRLDRRTGQLHIFDLRESRQLGAIIEEGIALLRFDGTPLLLPASTAAKETVGQAEGDWPKAARTNIAVIPICDNREKGTRLTGCCLQDFLEFEIL